MHKLNTEVKQFLLHGIKLAIEEKEDLNRRGIGGETRLHRAVWCGGLDAIKLLLDAGANPNITDDDGNTPLHNAADQSKSEIVRYLLERGAKPNILNKDGLLPLHMASAEGDVASVCLLLSHQGVNLPCQNNCVNLPSEEGLTPLHMAAEGGHLMVVEKLIEYGADVKAKDKDGDWPVVYAEHYNHREVANYLRERAYPITELDCPELSELLGRAIEKMIEEKGEYNDGAEILVRHAKHSE